MHPLPHSPQHFSASPRWLRPRPRPTRASEAVTYNPRTKGSDMLSGSVKEVLTNACRAERAHMCHELCARWSEQQVGVGPAGHSIGGCESGRAYSRRVGCGDVSTCAPSRWVCADMVGCMCPYGCVHRETGGWVAATSLYLQPLNLSLSGVAEKPPSCTGEDRGVNTLAGPSSLQITQWC